MVRGGNGVRSRRLGWQLLAMLCAALALAGCGQATHGRPASSSPNPSQSASASSSTAAQFVIGRPSGDVQLIGSVPDDATRQAFIAAASSAAPGRPVDASLLIVQAGAKPPVTATLISELVVALGAQSAERAISWHGATVRLTGTVPDAATAATIEQRVRSVLGDVPIDDQFGVGTTLPTNAPAVQQDITALLRQDTITFGPNSADLSPSSAPTLSRVAQLLLANPLINIEVDGYTARTEGTSPTPQALSEARAAAVAAALIADGVAATRITTRGFGDTQPISSGTSPADLAADRRVEIRVVA